MENLLKFIKSQRLLSIATINSDGPWIANVYYVCDDQYKFYFLSSKDTKHSKSILNNPEVAVSITWFDQKNHRNRKSIQGTGVCRLANLSEIKTGVGLLYQNFPDLRDILTLKWVSENIWNSRIWVVDLKYVKYWDDEIYGDSESEEFRF